MPGIFEHTPGVRCCCKHPDCSVGANPPVGLKEITLRTTNRHPFEAITSGVFSRTTAGCCSTLATVNFPTASEQSHVSPVLSGINYLRDRITRPLYDCCNTINGWESRLIGSQQLTYQYAGSYAYQFRLRACAIDLSVCQTVKTIDDEQVCGLEVIAKIVFHLRINGESNLICQLETINTITQTTLCGFGSPPGTYRTLNNNCCGTSILNPGDSEPTDFVPYPTIPDVETPELLNCNFGYGINPPIYSNNGGYYFRIDRSVFLPGATVLPAIISFGPGGTPTVTNQFTPLEWQVTINPFVDANSQPSNINSPNPCPRPYPCTENFAELSAGFWSSPACISGRIPTDCNSNRVREKSQTTSIPQGEYFLHMLDEPWEIEIRDPA